MDFPLRLLPATAMPPHFLLRRDWVIARLAVLPVTAKPDFLAAFPCLAREMAFHQAVVAVSVGAHSSPEPDLFAVVLSVLSRCSTGFVPDDLVTSAVGPFGFAGSDSAVVVVVVAADPVFDLSVVAAGF